MSLITGHNLFLMLMGLLLLGFILVVPYLLAMHFLMPKRILATYWKEPYFRPFELMLFTGIPYAPMRTVMLMGVLAFPKLGRRRKLTEAYKLVPAWYRIASLVFVVSLFVSLFGILGISTGALIYAYAIGESIGWDVWLALIIGVLSIPLAIWLERRRRKRGEKLRTARRNTQRVDSK